MKEAIHQLAEFVCDPSVLLRDEGTRLLLNRKRLFASAQFLSFSKVVSSDPGIAELVDARAKASNAFHGDIARGITEEAIAYCWKNTGLKPENLAPRLKEQVDHLKNFKGSGYLPISMAVLLPVGIEESAELPNGRLEPLSESSLRHFSGAIDSAAPSWLDNGRGKAVYITHGFLSYSELIEGNLSRGVDHYDHHGLILLQLSIHIHRLIHGQHVPSLDAEMACQSGAISGGASFSKNTQYSKPQLNLTREDVRSIAEIAGNLYSKEFPHFPARRFVEALSHNRSIEDRLVDCVTGWEGLLMAGEKNELGFRLSLGLALLLDEEGSGAAIAADVKRIYGIRSMIVHGAFKLEKKGKKGASGQLKYEIELREACSAAMSLTKQLLRLLAKQPDLIQLDAEKVSEMLTKRLFKAEPRASGLNS